MGSARGALTAAARRLGIAPADYAHRVVSDEKWCSGCKAWHPIDSFGLDVTRDDGRAAICTKFRRRHARDRYVRVESPGPFGPPPNPARDGDKKQARRRINVLVRTGRLPHPNDLPCHDCGHVGGERRHEYDHHLGYGAEHHLDVQPVCTTCHGRRSVARGEYRRDRVREFPK